MGNDALRAAGYRSIFAQEFPLLRRVHVRPEYPLRLARIFDLQSSQFDLIQFHFKPRPHFFQLDVIVGIPLFRVLLERVVTEGDEILVVHEGEGSLRIRFWDGEQVFQDVADPEPQFGGEVVEDEVRVGFRHGPDFGNIVPHNRVHQLKISRRSVRQMTNDHPIC